MEENTKKLPYEKAEMEIIELQSEGFLTDSFGDGTGGSDDENPIQGGGM